MIYITIHLRIFTFKNLHVNEGSSLKLKVKELERECLSVTFANVQKRKMCVSSIVYILFLIFLSILNCRFLVVEFN